MLAESRSIHFEESLGSIDLGFKWYDLILAIVFIPQIVHYLSYEQLSLVGVADRAIPRNAVQESDKGFRFLVSHPLLPAYIVIGSYAAS